MSGREVCFDTETTGLEAKDHRIVELAAVEIVDLIPTGRTFHAYINPLRACDPEAFKVHGLTDAFLAKQPVMRKVMPDFLAFIGADPIVAHNAPFDVRFINAEMQRLGRGPITNPVVDTLDLSRKARPGRKHTLDALCRHYGISLAKRVKHGAMIDTEILAEAYQALRGGLQATLDLVPDVELESDPARPFRSSRNLPGPTFDELLTHAMFVRTMDRPIWALYDDFAEVDLPF